MQENSLVQDVIFVEPNQIRRFALQKPVFLLFFIIALLGFGIFFLYQTFFSPRAKALSEINTIIKMVKFPDKNLVKQYNINKDYLKSNTQQILEGAPDRKIPGLADVQKSIEQGDMTVAHDQLVVVFTTFLWNGAIPSENGGSDRVILTEAEKKQADPKNLYFSLKRIAPIFSGVRKSVSLRVIRLLYSLNIQNSKK